MMKFGLNPLTDTIYYGQVNEKRPNEWVGNKKKDVTNEAIGVVFQWFMSKIEYSEDEQLEEYAEEKGQTMTTALERILKQFFDKTDEEKRKSDG